MATFSFWQDAACVYNISRCWLNKSTPDLWHVGNHHLWDIAATCCQFIRNHFLITDSSTIPYRKFNCDSLEHTVGHTIVQSLSIHSPSFGNLTYNNTSLFEIILAKPYSCNMIHGSRWNTMIYQTLWQFLEHSCGKSTISARSSHFWGPKAEGGGHCRDGTAALALEFGPEPDERRDVRSRGKGLGCTWEILGKEPRFLGGNPGNWWFLRMETEGWPRVDLKYVETLQFIDTMQVWKIPF